MASESTFLGRLYTTWISGGNEKDTCAERGLYELEKNMTLPRGTVVLLLVLLGSGCAASRGVRLDTGEGRPFVYTPRTNEEPVRRSADEFHEAVQKLARTAPLSGRPREAALRLFNLGHPRAFAPVRGRLGLVSVEDPHRGRLLVPQEQDAEPELASAYGRWCQRQKMPRDCLHLLEEGVTLDEEGKRTLAFRLALDSVWAETAEALGELTDKEAMVTMLATTGAVYFALWLAPDPVLSKGIAATLTVALIGYLGWDTVWSLVKGWRVLAREVEAATTFDEIQDAGEKYGKVMGRNAARAFVMLAMAALGSTAQTLATRVPTLPGSAQASLVGVGQGGFRLAAAGQVTSVAVAPGGVITIALSPEAVAETARGTRAVASEPVASAAHEHHIATNKWWDSTSSGGPWSPRFQKLFDRAGMSLDDTANKVRVQGHKGPHPQKYHEQIYERLEDAMGGCRSIQQCREALVGELEALAREITQPGSRLNALVTRN
ncbi:A nuclease family of the HNH/ENDO VII superfamily with conserved AHH [Stigmatella aurantiaca]|uniref:A nuclease family of the HNH/ENDO VII superfamily with conserved AHH n=1 Tax=Stigmatella aurantiaca TaxID=41 RepID=A0A1H7MYS4_STIAU|nr:A nuclease family of the HNH/ENDO VII superfamily with conserved AHH [Stigmatella aurantiaca]